MVTLCSPSAIAATVGRQHFKTEGNGAQLQGEVG